MTEPPRLDWVESRVATVFGDRAGPVTLASWSCAFVVSTTRLAKVTAEEIRRLAESLDVRPLDVEIAVSDDGDGLMFFVGLDVPTPVDTGPLRPIRRK